MTFSFCCIQPLRLPLPIQEIVKFDVRQRCFDGNVGNLEETMTADEKNVIVGIYTIYSIKDLSRFKNAAKSLASAEEYLSNRMRTAKGAVVGKYRFDQMINTDPKKMMLSQMEADMYKQIAPDVMERYGIEVVKVGIRTISVPEKISGEIAKRMKTERETAAVRVKQRGNVEAENIKTKANQMKREEITKAEAQAKELEALLSEAQTVAETAAQATFFAEKVLPVMQQLRSAADEAESLTDERAWPFPTYGDLLFSVT